MTLENKAVVCRWTYAVTVGILIGALGCGWLIDVSPGGEYVQFSGVQVLVVLGIASVANLPDVNSGSVAVLALSLVWVISLCLGLWLSTGFAKYKAIVIVAVVLQPIVIAAAVVATLIGQRLGMAPGLASIVVPVLAQEAVFVSQLANGKFANRSSYRSPDA